MNIFRLVLGMGAIGLSACATSSHDLEVAKVDYCEVAANVGKYATQFVQTDVIVLQAFHGRSVGDTRCSKDIMDLNLEEYGRNERSVRRLYDLLELSYFSSEPPRRKVVEARIVAIVDAKKDNRGRHTLAVKKVLRAKIVDMPRKWGGLTIGEPIGSAHTSCKPRCMSGDYGYVGNDPTNETDPTGQAVARNFTSEHLRGEQTKNPVSIPVRTP